uniref:Uncharacterized protein n=1 Tax=viral metagenome TaxID=1070528 RepID=A0A6C0IXJ5_9ZZZZ
MEELMTRAEAFKEQSLKNFQELTFGKETIPIASCPSDGNAYVLSRCEVNKIYDNKSNVVPNTVLQQEPSDIKAFNE